MNRLVNAIIRRIKPLFIFYYVDRYKSRIARFIVIMLKFFRVKKCKNISVSEWCRKNDIKMVEVRPECNKEIFIPSFLNKPSDSQTICVKTPNVFFCKLNDIYVCPKSNFLLSKNLKYCLDERILWRDANEIKWCKQSACLKHTEKNAWVEIEKSKSTFDKAIPLCFAGSANYYHFMFDVAGACSYIKSRRELDGIPILVCEILKQRKNYVDLLKLILGDKHEIVFVESHKSYFVKEAYYFSPCSWLNVFSFSRNLPSENPDFLLKYAKNDDVTSMYNYLTKLPDIQNALHPSDKYKKVFLTRGEKARIVNEKELAVLSEKYGFFIVDASSLNILEQISLFSNAEIVLADYGAGCANVVFCRQSTHFYIFTPSNRIDYIFSTTGYEVGVDVRYILTEPYDDSLKRSFDLNEFKQILERIATDEKAI